MRDSRHAPRAGGFFSPGFRRRLDAMNATVHPTTAALLGTMPPHVLAGLKGGLQYFNEGPVAQHGKRFTALDDATATAEAAEPLPEAPRLTVDTPELVGSISLLGGRIDDLSAHCEVTAVGQRRIEAREELVDRLGLYEPLAEQPHRGRIGHPAIEPQPKEPLEREPILDLELGRLV